VTDRKPVCCDLNAPYRTADTRVYISTIKAVVCASAIDKSENM
jgi:hypothetical protein